MSASHHNVTCSAGKWAALNTFSMIASKVREGIYLDGKVILDMTFHGPHIGSFSLSSNCKVRKSEFSNATRAAVCRTVAKESKLGQCLNIPYCPKTSPPLPYLSWQLHQILVCTR